MAFPASMNLGALGAVGVELVGPLPHGTLGDSVGAAGDLNGDGYADIVMGGDGSSPGGIDSAGSVYVVFGGANGLATTTLSSLNGVNGFRIHGFQEEQGVGFEVSGGLDLNGDGFDDLIVAADQTTLPSNGGGGSVYVIFGKAGGFSATLDLTALNGQNGFRIDGSSNSDRLGTHTNPAGDFNGDGLDDLILGAPGQGGGYVVYGRAGGFAAAFNAETMPLSQGFRFFGGGGNSGWVVSSAGDINNDGIDDLLIGASQADPDGRVNAGATYVVYGKAGGLAADIALGALTPAQGFTIKGGVAGVEAGFSAAAIGDFNGDGVGDIVIGAQNQDYSTRPAAGSAYVIFGRAAGGFSDIDLSALPAGAGFRIVGANAFDRLAYEASAAGDVNGDGYDDILMSARGSSGGGAVVLFGHGGAQPALVDLAALTAGQGVRFSAESGGDFTGSDVSGVGDVNGDGADDFLIGQANGNGNVGGAYLIYGQVDLTPGATGGADVLSDQAGLQRISAGAGDDSLSGLSGDDRLLGGAGTDKSLYAASAKDYAWWREDDGSWRVQDLRGGSPEGTDTLLSIEQLQFADRTIKIAGATVGEQLGYAYENIMRATASGAGAGFLNGLTAEVSSGAKTLAQAYGEIAQRADGTTAVAAMTYQFFLGYAPSKGGFDYLVSPTGPNPNNINSAYFQFFSQENRYINFAVSVGSLGDGKPGFTADYGSLTLRQATAKAYQEIFGGTAPNEAFLNLLLDADVGNGMTRKDYFAYYGGDGLTGLGTKAAMVGWLLTEAVKADVGVYARSNNAYLQDLADGAQFLVDMVGVYSQPDWAHNAPG